MNGEHEYYIDGASSDSDCSLSNEPGLDTPVPNCEGFPRKLWVTKCVTLKNEAGVDVAEGICHSINSELVLGHTGPLEDSHVGVQILMIHNHKDVPDDWCY